MARAKASRSRRATSSPAAMTRAERRAAIGHRRGTAAVVAAAIASAIVLVAWFPAGALIAQRHTLSATSSTLTQLRAEDRALRAESKNLSKPSEISRIARQQFQLIVPGDQAFQILPPPGSAGGDTDPYSGDPGNAAPVSPSVTPEVPPGSVHQNTTSAKAKSRH
ncbi:MAG: FtsB family cell division protein, partial [Acidimicrobiales bacterium]